MDIVKFEQAKRLYALGYRGQFPQMVWMETVSTTYQQYCLEAPAFATENGVWVYKDYIPAPSYLEALKWLDEEKAIPWISIYAEDDATMENVRTWVTWIGPKKLYSAYPSASDLLAAILEKETADGS